MMDVNKATAQELGTPALARLSLRQRYVKYIILQLITFALDQAEMKGLIKRRDKLKGKLAPTPWAIHVNLPDLKQSNQIVIAQALNNIVAGALAAMEGGLIDLQLAQEVLILFIEQLGIDVNLEALKARLEENPPELNIVSDNPRLRNLKGNLPRNTEPNKAVNP